MTRSGKRLRLECQSSVKQKKTMMHSSLHRVSSQPHVKGADPNQTAKENEPISFGYSPPGLRSIAVAIVCYAGDGS